MGTFLLKKVSVGRIIAGSLGASVLFFLLTNFAVWAGNTVTYPMTLGGLLLCYEAALPFFTNTVAGDLVYCGVMFGAYEWVRANKPQWVVARA